MLIKNQDHGRNKEKALDSLINTALDTLGEETRPFLTTIRHNKSRYARDQFLLLVRLCGQYGKAATLEAIGVCAKNGLCSATYVKDCLKNQGSPLPHVPVPAIPVGGAKYHVTAEKRDLSAYVKAGGRR
jgi:hypothetical protein